VNETAPGFFARLKQRKLVQWALAYVAFAFALLQGVDIVAQRFAWPDQLERILILALAIGFFFAIVLAWYHGERGAQRVTGTELLILALLLAIGGGLLWQFERTTSATSGPDAAQRNPGATLLMTPIAAIPAKSIAVLPFENLSEDKGNAYFAEGMQDLILTKLADIGDLKVISRTSTAKYESHPDNLKTIARQLGVATILEGSVQKAGNQVLINVQLIDAHSDNHLWAESYTRTLDNIFGVEGEVAQKVADALKAKLSPADTARVTAIPTRNPEAYDLFLQGQYLFQQLQTASARDPIAVGEEATDVYERAVAADPQFALGYAQLSYLRSYLHWYGVDRSAAVVDGARDAAEHALALQPDLPEAHLAMGYFHYWCHRDYAAALRELDIARAGMPNNAEVIAAIGYVHRRQGVPDMGIPEMQQASVLDPRDSTLPREIANTYVAMRRYADADAAYARSLAIFPGDIQAREERATGMMFSGDLPTAERMLAAVPADMDPQTSVSLLRFRLAMIQRKPDAALAVFAHAPDWLMTRWEHSVAPLGLLRGQAFTMKGETDLARAAFLQAEQALQTEIQDPETAIDASSYLGLVYAGLGEKQAALKAARSAVDRLPMSRDPIVGAFQLERLARVEAQVGETGSAIDHLRQLLDSASGETVSVATLRIDPVWDPLRGDPRFQALLAKYADRLPATALSDARHE
jgi:TolB-like protein/Tfp pilus assembly protein PilF